jgi:hypothetical protein
MCEYMCRELEASYVVYFYPNGAHASPCISWSQGSTNGLERGAMEEVMMPSVVHI